METIKKMYRFNYSQSDFELIKICEGFGSLLVLLSMGLLSSGYLFEGWIVGLLSAITWSIFAYKADHGYMLLLQIALFFIAINGIFTHG